ncbi:MAG: ATP-dependent helicase HrpB [Gammaproteobacteria bacterium]|nr:ATP-dependent helicase HrpB [Gammaproteobacteria bacterium]
MHNLPIKDVLSEILDTLSTHNRVVLQAPPGAGKTTAVPIALLNQAWLRDKQIIVLEPRRIAARNAAARMAFLLNEKPGETVGYQIRQERCFSDKTKILVVTEGILTRKLQADPELEKVALVIFDEFHERSLHADLSLALCLQSQQILNEKLKILVMSATLNTAAISDLLDNAPIIQSAGRSYPVDIRYLDKPIKQSGSVYDNNRALISHITDAVKWVMHEYEGSCLVFLPGVKEINQLLSQLQQIIKSELITDIIVTPLHGSLSKLQQNRAIDVCADGIRKIVLATNIAETSLTIDGISCVIDSGLERILKYSSVSAMNGLKTQFISEDSATQRAGRAGRLSAGICLRMWTSQQQQRLVKHSLAEILYSDLSTLVLELTNWGALQVNELQWMDEPPEKSVEQAVVLLRKLNAVDECGKINDHGRALLNLGSHPRLAHMIISSIKLNQAYHACLIASILSEKDLFYSQKDKTLDIIDRINILNEFKTLNKLHHDVDKQQCQRIIKTADDFYRRIKGDVNASNNKVDISYSGVLLAYAYPDRIAKQRRPGDARYLLSNGKGAFIPEYLAHHLYEYIVVANLDDLSGRGAQGEAIIYLAAEISSSQLHEYFNNLIESSETTQWNETQQRVEVKQSTTIGKLSLKENLITPEDKRSIHECLLLSIKRIGLDCLNWTPEAKSLRNRLLFIDYYVNHNDIEIHELKTSVLPEFSDDALINTMHLWLLPHLSTENSIKQVNDLDLYALLKSQLSWDQRQLVNHLAPEKINVPSGSKISIDYSDIIQPVLAVRLQEVFGLYETPVILCGHCRLMMHLLSPARKPMQVTQDLNSFWKTTYFEVKKELRGKYKRHYWPDDPFTAQATSKTKKNMHR